MNRGFVVLVLVIFCWLAFPHLSPAPWIYRPGEGWMYEAVGSEGKWMRTRAKDQWEVAQEAFERKNYSTALKAARRVVKVWPLSDYAPQAQRLIGQSYEAIKQDERAFKAYQTTLEHYPKVENYEDILQQQYEICNRFLAGQWFKLWGYIPFFPSMEKTATMYEKVVRNGPFSEVAPQAQMDIGAAREKQSDFPKAAKAYERAADQYHDRPQVAANAMFKAGLVYQKQARTAEYDQNTAAQAIAMFTDFMTLFPDDSRVPEAQRNIESLKTEQSRGSYEIARYYEKRNRWNAALIYYNDSVLKDPNSPYATPARERIAELKKRTETASR